VQPCAPCSRQAAHQAAAAGVRLPTSFLYAHSAFHAAVTESRAACNTHPWQAVAVAVAVAVAGGWATWRAPQARLKCWLSGRAC
jgi:ribulose-5-phosphate 4-epimerase/fuculose-1-phosphate aldolase